MEVLYRFVFASLGMLPVMCCIASRGCVDSAELRVPLIERAFGVPLQFLLQFHGLVRGPL